MKEQPDKLKGEPQAPSKPRTARVRVLKHRLRVGAFTYAEGHELPEMNADEAELRMKNGEVELIELNP